MIIIEGIIWINGLGCRPGVELIHESILPWARGEDYVRYRRGMLLFKIIGRFKMQTSQEINILQKTEGESVWQRGFYDRVTRDLGQFKAIRRYIKNNPKIWDRDQNNF